MNEHPIQPCPKDTTLLERVHWLELHLAMLWDQVWWMNLPAEKRDEYKAHGFTDPIEKFYGRTDPWPR